MMSSSIFTANRIAGIAAFLTGLSGAILAITNNFPKNWQDTAIAIAGILGAIATALHFMLGSQKSEANHAQLQMANINLEHMKVIRDLEGMKQPKPIPAQTYQTVHPGTPPETLSMEVPETLSMEVPFTAAEPTTPEGQTVEYHDTGGQQ